METQRKTNLNIDGEKITGIEQFQGIFSKTISAKSRLFMDLLEEGRNGEISAWLREHQYDDLAIEVSTIGRNLSDSEYIKELVKTITRGTEAPYVDKYPWRDAMIIRDVLYEGEGDERFIVVPVYITRSVNENYHFTFLSDGKPFGMPFDFNPCKCSYKEGSEKQIKVKLYDTHILSLKIDDSLIFEWKTDACSGEGIINQCEAPVWKEDVFVPNTETDEIAMSIGPDLLIMKRVEYYLERKSMQKKVFFISQTPITQSVWKFLMNYNPSVFVNPACSTNVMTISEVERFISEISDFTHHAFRLPSEDEMKAAFMGQYINCNPGPHVDIEETHEWCTSAKAEKKYACLLWKGGKIDYSRDIRFIQPDTHKRNVELRIAISAQ